MYIPSPDAFVTELTADGTTLVYSTYLDGLGTAAGTGKGIALDSSGDAYVAGNLTSSLAGFLDKLNSSGSALVYGTTLGLNGSSNANAVAVDGRGYAYVTGSSSSMTASTSGTVQPAYAGGGSDAFVEVANASGSLVYGTFLGGSGADAGYGISAVGGNITVVGATASSNFPTSHSLYSYAGSNDAFVASLNTALTTFHYSTLVGGTGSSDDTEARAVAVDARGDALVAGFTNSTNFPTVNPYQGSLSGTSTYDAFVMDVLPGPAAPQFTGITPDTGTYSTDQITTSQNIHLLGTSAPSATVTLYRSDVAGALGTTTADGSGNWNYDYSATTLAQGTYAFTATQTVSSQTSDLTADYLVTVDRTAPTVTLAVLSPSTSLKPTVRVNASDNVNLPDGTSVTVGVYDSTGTTLQFNTTGTLSGGTALVKLSSALTVSTTYVLKASVTDLAGNTGTSANKSWTITSSGSSWTTTGQALSSDPTDGNSQEQLGNVSDSHALDLDKSPGTSQSQGASFVYNSDSTSVKAIVQASIQSDNSTSLPATITGTLTWDYNTGSATTQTFSYSTSGDSPGDVLTIAVQVSSAVTTSGRHPWQLQISTPGGTKTVTGYSFVDVQDTSHYGAGWTFSGTDQLLAVAADTPNGLPAGLLRESGTGEWRFYTDTGGGTYSSPAGDNGTLSKTGNTYTYSTPDGQSWTFNNAGYETQWQSADGKETMQFAYDASNKLTTVTSIDGTTATFNYDGTTNLLTTVSEPGGRTVSLAYDSSTNPNLTSITNPDGGTHTFAYDTSNHLTSETFGGTQNNWAYTSNGTLGTFTWGSLTGAGGASNPSTTTVVAADTQGLSGAYANTVTASTTDGNGRIASYQLDGQGRTLARTNPDGGTMSYAYNSSGFLTTQTDELGRTTTYALDSKGYVTLTTLPDGNTTSAAYQSNFHAMTTSTDERGNTTTFQYDSAGHLTAAINALGQTTTDAYDATTGLRTAETDANGHATNFYYDTNRRITKVTDANGHSTTTTYDGNGNVQTTVDARGYTTTYSDDAMGRTTATTDPNGNVTSQTWDAASLALVSTDARGTQGSVVYDGFKRGLVSASVEGIGTAVQRSTLDSYDNAGQMTGSRDGNGWWTTNGRDAVGRETSTKDARGAIRLTQYDLAGEVTSTRDALGDLTQDFYNLRGWLTKTIDATGAVSTFQYDQAGDKTAEVDPLGHTVTFQYDKLDRVTTQIDALSKTSTTAFDNAGNVLSETDANGHTVSYGYDNAEQRTTTIDAYGTSHAETLTTSYDQDNNVTQETRRQRPQRQLWL
jgi:YD repeat-containing protein